MTAMPVQQDQPRVVLSARGLGKHFAGFTAVNDVDLDVEHGRIHPLIGPNGAGKTTMLGAAIEVTAQHGKASRMVAPTLRAAQVAHEELDVPASSVAALVHAHGWRWNDDGAWTRLAPGDTDPETGRNYRGPSEAARLARGERVIVDEAGQKGTGRWTAISGLDVGSPVAAIAESVFARSLSSQRAVREVARETLAAGVDEEAQRAPQDTDTFVEDVRQALFASKLVAYAQGMDMLAAAAEEYGWSLDLGTIASLWRDGCIIRADLLDVIMQAFGGRDTSRHPAPGTRAPGQPLNLLFAPEFAQAIAEALPAWRRVVGTAVAAGVPVPVFSSALAYYDGLRADRLPAALVQGQRDYFGAHTYLRVDREGSFHTLWSGDRTEVDGEGVPVVMPQPTEGDPTQD